MGTRSAPQAGIVSRTYGNSSLRTAVIVIGVLSTIWSLLWAIDAFQSISVDKDHGQPKLATLAIALGSIYMVACVIELFGITAAATQRIAMIKIFAVLSVVGAFSVIGAALMRVIIHFMLKNDLISECEQIAMGSTVVEQFGFWGPKTTEKLTPQEAGEYCGNAWNHDSFIEIISLVLEIIFSGLFSFVAFMYSSQAQDPTHPSNVQRIPASAGDDTYPAHYNPPYLGYNAPAEPYAEPQYAPPPGSPPKVDYGGAKPPDYGEPHGYGGGVYGAEKDDPFADFESGSVRRGSREALM